MCNVPLDNHNQQESVHQTPNNTDVQNNICKSIIHDKTPGKINYVPSNVVVETVPKQNDSKVKIISDIIITKPSKEQNDKMCYGNDAANDVNISSESSVISVNVSKLN